MTSPRLIAMSLLLLLPAACSETGQGSGDASAGDASAGTDGPVADAAPTDASAPDAAGSDGAALADAFALDVGAADATPEQTVAGTFDSLSWELPCKTTSTPTVCATPGLTTAMATVPGAPGVTYDVVVRFRGVVETESYMGGSDDGAYWQVGGAPNGDAWNVYKLEISAPPQVYYLNKGQSGLYNCFAIDYQKTIQATSGATVTLTADPVDGSMEEIRNVDTGGQPISVAGTRVAQPYDGQFIEMDVVSVTKAVPGDAGSD